MTTLAAPERADGDHRDAEIVTRLRKASGQLGGVAAMVEDRRYCLDILDQLAAVAAAIDAAAMILLEDHMNTCVRAAVDYGDAETKVSELSRAVRRYVRSK